jgi:hypothetical protein
VLLPSRQRPWGRPSQRGGGRPWGFGARLSWRPAPRAPFCIGLALTFCVLGCLVEGNLPSKKVLGSLVCLLLRL